MEAISERLESRKSGLSTSETQDEQILTFEVGQDLWGLPLDSVREVVELAPLTPVPRAPDCVAGVLMLHGRAVTIIPMAPLVDQPKLDHTADERILVMESNLVILHTLTIACRKSGVRSPLNLPTFAVRANVLVFALGSTRLYRAKRLTWSDASRDTIANVYQMQPTLHARGSF